MLTPELETKRLILRPFCESDGEEVYHCWENDPEVSKYMFWESHDDVSKSFAWAKEEEAKAKDPDWYRWAVLLKERGTIIGTGLIYYNMELQRYEIGYNFGRAYWGNGYATEAMQKILEYAKERLSIEEVYASHAIENPASGNVIRKLGFQFQKEVPYECGHGSQIGKEYRFQTR